MIIVNDLWIDNEPYDYNQFKGAFMKIFTGFILCIPFILFVIFRIVADYNFSIDCSGHMKRAADANTIELAIQELTTVIKYCDNNDLTKGTVSIFLHQPKNDIGFWYTNIKSSLDQLKQVTSQTSQLEKTNMLIKLRETLLDNGKEGVCVTHPEGISIYPNNVLYFVWVCAGVVLAFFGIGLICIGIDEF